MIIGICGKSGSGKSTYARKLSRERNAILIDVDKVVHDILQNDRVKMDIGGLLGTDKFIENGAVNTKSLGSILFNDKNLLNAYNKLIYKEIEFVMDKILSSAKLGGVDAVIDWALLPMSKYYKLCDEKILIKKPDEAREKCVKFRDTVDTEYFKKRDSHALEYNEKDFDKVLELEMKMRGFFAGSFDPFTSGHWNIVEQARKDFDKVVVGIGCNPDKLRRFDRYSMQSAILKTAKEYEFNNVESVIYSGMTGEKAIELECPTLVRGIRNEKDREYEKKVADYNKENYGLQTVYYTAPEWLSDVSSSHVKNLMRKNQCIDGFVPRAVAELIN